MALSSLQTSLRSSWRIACRSNALDSKKPTSAQVFEHKIVLTRDKWGRISAFKDRDSVRGFPLSSGAYNARTRGLESLYDRYRYDSEGKLVGIPSSSADEAQYGKEVDATMRVPKYHVAEQDGYVWVWTGKEEPEGDPMEIPGVSEYIWTQQTLNIDADPNLCLQLEMDWPSSLTQGRMTWAYRRAMIPLQKSMTLEQAYEARTTESGFELFQPPTTSPSDPKLRQARTSTFSLPDRVVHQKLLKRKFWRGFGDFVSVAHFVPVVDPITGKVTTRAEYMWTPIILPGYAFQRNKITTFPQLLSRWIYGDRLQDKATLEILQNNINHWDAVDRLGIHPNFMEIGETTSNSSPQYPSSSRSLTIGARPAFGSEARTDSPSTAVSNIVELAANGLWNSENAHIIVPTGRHQGVFNVTHADS